MRQRKREHHGQSQRRRGDRPRHRQEQQQVHRDEWQHAHARCVPEGPPPSDMAEQVAAKQAFLGDPRLGEEARRQPERLWDSS